jgi:hypothetical protein
MGRTTGREPADRGGYRVSSKLPQDEECAELPYLQSAHDLRSVKDWHLLGLVATTGSMTTGSRGSICTDKRLDVIVDRSGDPFAVSCQHVL